MNTTAPVRTPRLVLLLLLALGLALLGSASSAHAAPHASTVEPPPQRSANVTSVTWLGAAGDGRWSNPANWEGHHLPGPDDIVRFNAASPDARVDAAFPGIIGGIELEPGFAGTLSLDKALAVRGDLTMQGGTLAGESADLWIEGAAHVSGGLLTTPGGMMHAERMDIHAPGIVRLGANGKLNLAGDGTPLTGDGVLDMTTNSPNSIEYTGQATSDLMSAGPLRSLGMPGLDDGEIQALDAMRHGGAFQPNSLVFGEAGSMMLVRGEDSIRSAVIDSLNEYAYFGASTSPGQVIKFRLSDMTRIGAIVLNPGESYLESAVLDSANGFAYFGTRTSPGKVVKIRLSDFTRTDALILNADETNVRTAVLDSVNGFIYVNSCANSSCSTYGSIVKIRLSDFSRVGTLTLLPNDARITSAVIDPLGGYAYFGSTGTSNPPYSTPSRVVKVRLSDFSRVGALLLNSGEESLSSAVIDSANGYAYFGVNTAPAKVVKINLADFSRQGALTFNTGENNIYSAVIDSLNGFAYWGQGLTVVQVRLADFSRSGVVTFTYPDGGFYAGVIDTISGYAYFGTSQTPGRVVKIQLSTLTQVCSVGFNAGEEKLRTAVIDSANGFAYFGTTTWPGRVVKIRVSDFTRVGALQLDRWDDLLAAAVIDSANGFAYFGSGTTPLQIDKVRLSDFARVGGINLPGDYRSFDHAVIDPASGFAYFTICKSYDYNQPGEVARIRLSDFSYAGTVHYGQQCFSSAAIDPVNGFAYFGRAIGPAGMIDRVRLTDSSVRVVTLESGEINPSPAVIDVTNGYAYFGTGPDTSPGKIIRVRLSDFSRVDAITLEAGDGNLKSAVIDSTNGYAYFATGTSPGKVIKIRLSDFSWDRTITLNSGENDLTSAVIDPDNHFAYFGTNTNPSFVVRADLSSGGQVSTTLSSSANPSRIGQAVMFTAAVSAVTPGTPTGTVTFKDNGTVLCSNVTLTAGEANCSTSSLSLGAHTITARYSGDSVYDPARGTLTDGQVVIKADTTTTVTSHTPDPSKVGQGVIVSYSVAVNTPGSGTPTGNVTVSDGTNSCTGSAGAGQCTLALTSAGVKNVSATYAGDTSLNGSTSASVAHTAEKADTTVTISSDNPDPSVVGQVVAVQFSIVVNAPGAGTPTGEVSVSDGTVSCIGTIAAGQCSLTLTTAGTKALIASYAGDSNFKGSSSSGQTHQVNKASTTTTIILDNPDPSVVGQSVTVQYLVAPVAPGAGAPTGNVTVSDGSVSCTGTVTAGQCSLAFTSAGAKSLTATYAGDSNFNASTSSSQAHQVIKANTTAGIISDAPDPSLVGQVVVVQFSVTANAPGGGTPTGDVTVGDGALSCTGTVAAGQCPIAFTSSGVKSLTASYAGDNNFSGSASAFAPHQVSRADTATTITSHTPDPSGVGQSVTVSYTVAPMPPGAGAPAGDVTVGDGMVSCSGTVAAGACSLTFTTHGSKTLTATYAGDGNFNGSTSPAASHTVNQFGTTVTLTASANPSVVGQTITYTATVSGETTGTPTGWVAFKDGGTIICTAVTLIAGNATCTLSYSTPGVHSITAEYSGDRTFNPTSGTLGGGQHINKAYTTTTLTGHSPNPSKVARAVTVYFFVAVNAPGSGTPSGNVTVSDGVDSCTGTVAAGSCVVTLRTVGTRTLTATYAGDVSFKGSTSSGIFHTVNLSGLKVYLPLLVR